jgi:hypothetical protein
VMREAQGKAEACQIEQARAQSPEEEQAQQ